MAKRKRKARSEKTSANSAAKNHDQGKFAYEGLDRVMHEKARLGIMTSLFTHRDGLLFNDLKEMCSLTDGNLSRHLQILNDAELIEIWKGFQHKRPQTLLRLTVHGRKRFRSYLEELDKILQTVESCAPSKTQTADRQKEAPKANLLSQGWVPA